MSTQDLGQYIPAVRQNGVRLNANEPLVVAGTATFSGAVSINGISSGTPASLASSATVTFTPSTVVTTHTPTQAETINFGAAPAAGTAIFLEVVTSGVTSYVLTFGTNTKNQGTLATGTVTAKTFIVEFVSDGTNWVEVARTSAM